MKKDTRFMVLFFTQCILVVLLGILVYQNLGDWKIAEDEEAEHHERHGRRARPREGHQRVGGVRGALGVQGHQCGAAGRRVRVCVCLRG